MIEADENLYVGTIIIEKDGEVIGAMLISDSEVNFQEERKTITVEARKKSWNFTFKTKH